MGHTRLSQRLVEILSGAPADSSLTVNELLARTEGHGIYLMLIVLSLPFIAPISIPGLSTVLGLVVALVAARLAVGLPPGLPRWIGGRRLSRAALERTVHGGMKLVRLIEWGVKPRRSEWLRWRWMRFVNASLLAVLGLLLALPIPPVIPLSNTLPAYAIILVAASVMEEDGWMIWVGYAVSATAVGYLAFLAGVAVTFVLNHYERWLQAWFVP